MTDTTQIGEESDMLHLQSIFAKAANAIVEASQLRKEVAKLQDEMHTLSTNVAHLQASNETLVSELSAIRQEKTELHNKLWQAEGEISQLKATLEDREKAIDNLWNTIHSQATEIDRLTEEKAKLSSALNEAINKAADLAAQLTEVKDAHQKHLEEIRQAHDDFRAAYGRVQDVVAKGVPSTTEGKVEVPAWNDVKAAVQEATPEAGPFGGDQGETASTSGTSGEQPRAENGRFEPIPMAAKDFEW